MSDIHVPLTPLADRVVVKPGKPEETTASGIIIPTSKKEEQPQQGIVLAVGPGAKDDDGERVAMEVKVGDSVLFSKYSPDSVEIDGETYLVMREDAILAVFNK